jgi:hypothetical protein
MEPSAELAKGLSAPFRIDLEGGAIRGWHEPAAEPPMVTTVRRALLAALQLGEAPRDSSEWDAHGWDGTGRFLRHCVTETGRVVCVKDRYERYLVAAGAGSELLDGQIGPRIEKSHAEVKLDDDRRLVRLLQVERTQMPLGVGTNLSSDSSLEVTLVAHSPGRGDWTDPPGGLIHRPSDATYVAAEAGDLRAIKAGSASVDELLASLGASLERGEPPEARARAFFALGAQLEGAPKVPPTVARRAAESSDLGHLVLDALSMAATPDAVAVLERLTLEEPRPLDERRRAASALARVSRPSRALLDALRGCARDPEVDEFGLMGLGTAARRAREAGDKALADQADEALRSELGKGTSRRQADTLLGVANSGGGSLYQAALPFQDSTDPSIREAAIQAIRLMPGPEPTTRLLELLARQPLGDLRAALGALRHRTGVSEAAVARVEQLARHESLDVRLDATRALGAWARSVPAARRALTGLAGSAGDPKVQELARQLGG